MFTAAWTKVCADGEFETEASAQLGADLLRRHHEPHRRYHDVGHIEAVLHNLDTLRATSVAARLAAFFHDAIYDPTRSDNEAMSAELAKVELALLGAPDDLIGVVAAMISATARHAPPTDHSPDPAMGSSAADLAAFLDADLAILGTPQPLYDRYVANTRIEYAHVDDAGWLAGRAAVLVGFLERPTIYFTIAGRDLWEAAARSNLARELESLRRV